MDTPYYLQAGETFFAELDPQRCILRVTHRDVVYAFSSERPPFLEAEVGGAVQTLTFDMARSVLVREYAEETGGCLRARYADFYCGGTKLPLCVETVYRLRGDEGSLECELEVTGDEAGAVRRVCFPQPLDFDCEDGEAYTVLPMMQGTLIPAKWKNTVKTYSDGRYFESDGYMPWWGQAYGGGACQCVCETPWDGGYALQHEPGGETAVCSAWYPSLGRMAYRRKCRFYFFRGGDYNAMCLNYRRIVERRGELLTLREKIARTPSLAARIGKPVVHDFLFVSVDKLSPMYRRRLPQMNEYFYSFEYRWKQIEALLEKGAAGFTVHLDGCGNRGYDNGHPDLFPINEAIGGEEGMRRFAALCREHGLPFDIHDQYRDFYFNAPSFRQEQAVFDRQGNLPVLSLWQGGRQSLLCATQASDYLERNLKRFQDSGIAFDGIHLGSFSGGAVDECFNPLHPMSKRECIEARRAAFALARSHGLAVGSDEPMDCFLPWLDTVSHAPYSLSPSLWNGIGNGIPVPLFNLVYHDAVLVHWNSFQASLGSWGIPNNDRYSTHAALNANPAYLSIDAGEEEIAECTALCELSRSLAFERMIRHEFLSGNFRRQRATYSDGTAIEVDFDADTYRVYPGKS